MNEILRRAILNAGLDEVDVAARLEVDPKTVLRWLEGRVPYNRHRWALADLLKLEEADLWPELRPSKPQPDELLGLYPHRSSITRETWRNLFASAQHEISVLDHSSLFLAEDPGILRIFAEKARGGIGVRIALTDPNSLKLKDEALVAEIHKALDRYQQLRQVTGVELRLHQIWLYNSIYRADNELFCSQHAYGVPASQCPTLHLQHRGGYDLTSTYFNSLDQIWKTAHG